MQSNENILWGGVVEYGDFVEGEYVFVKDCRDYPEEIGNIYKMVTCDDEDYFAFGKVGFYDCDNIFWATDFKNLHEIVPLSPAMKTLHGIK